MIDVSQIKKDFPIFKRLINGKPLVYLDSTASTLKPQQVIEAINNYYTKFSANIFRGVYNISEEATAKYEEARQKVANFIGCKNPSEIVFTRNATEAINLVSFCWSAINLKPGDEIVTTVMEHHANLVPWQAVCKQKGSILKILDIDEQGQLKLDELDLIVSAKTKLFALTAVSNVLGTINPVSEIAKAVKRINPKCIVLVDAAARVPHMEVNVNNWGCDFIAFSGHKMLGPTGIGVLWGKYELLSEIPPYQYGGEMIKKVTLQESEFKDPPFKFEAGTPHIAGSIGLGAAVDYLSSMGMENIRQHELTLVSYATISLKKIKDLIIYGPTEPEKRGGSIAFTIKGIHPHDLAQILDFDNICIRVGHHCAMPLHSRFNIPASARASFYIYNDKEDVDKLVEGIEKAKKILSK